MADKFQTLPSRSAIFIVFIAIAFLNLSAKAKGGSGAELRFEVASIKPSPPGTQLTIDIELRHGRLRGSNVTLRQMIAAAYGLTDPRVIGPSWLDRYHFDVMAKSPDSIPDSEMKALLQSLLHDRFQLRAHFQTAEMTGYDLIVAKGGVKMSAYPAAPRFGPLYGSGFPMMRGTMTMSQLAEMISRTVGRPVFDKTGLSERYNFLLTFAPLSAMPLSLDRPICLPRCRSS